MTDHWKGRVSIVSVFALALAGSEVVSQPATYRVLDVRRWADDTFEDISGIVEVDDGVLISSAATGSIWKVHQNGSRTLMTRGGAVVAPGGLLRLSKDSVITYERSAQRFLLLRGSDAPVPAPSRFAVTPTDGRIELNNDRFLVTAAGDLAWSDWTRGAVRAVLRRQRSGSTATDSLTSLSVAPTHVSRSGGIGITMFVPFTAIDDAAITDAGDLVVVRGEPYRVDLFRRDGRVALGSPTSTLNERVSADDRARYAATQRRGLQGLQIGGSLVLPQLPDSVWPAQFAPFAPRALRVAPDGTAWVHVLRSASAEQTLIDVFTPGAKWRERVALPKSSRIVGFGATYAYVAVGDSAVTLHRVPWR